MPHQRLPGETDDRGAMARRYADELRNELAGYADEAELIARLAGDDGHGGRYRVAIRHAAAGLIQYSGAGYPLAGLEPYGPDLVGGPGLEGTVELARRLIDAIDLGTVARAVGEVLDTVELAGIGRPAFTTAEREAVARRLLELRRAAKAAA